jgi:hypothetical protein
MMRNYRHGVHSSMARRSRGSWRMRDHEPHLGAGEIQTGSSLDLLIRDMGSVWLIVAVVGRECEGCWAVMVRCLAGASW